jgi:hypothetical protein
VTSRAALLAALGAVAMTAASPSRADAWSLEPRLRVATEYSDNARLTVDEHVADALMQVEAALRFTGGTETLDFSIEPRVLATRYRRESVLDSTNRAAIVQIQRRGERSVLTFGATLLRDTTLTSELGESGRTDVDYPHRRLGFSAQAERAFSERWSGSAQFGWSDDRYSAPLTSGLNDYRYLSGTLATSYALSEKTRLSLQTGTSRLAVPGRPLTWNHSAMVAISRTLTERFQLRVAAGPSRVVRSGQSDGGQSLQLALTHSGERLRSTLSLVRENAPTGRGLLDRRDRWSLELSAPLGETTTATLALARVHSRDIVPGLGFVADELRYTAVNGVLRRQLTPALAATLSLGWQSQRLARDGETAQGLRGGIALHWTGRPWKP